MNEDRDQTKLCWIGLGLVLLGVFLLRARLLDVPLERDEGDYAYFGMLLTQGVSLVDPIVRVRFPLISGLYAIIISLFGQTAAGVHAGLLVLNLMTTVLLFLVGRKLFGPLVGLLAAAFFAVLDVSPTVQGFSANREQFLIFFAVAALWVLLVALERRRAVLFFLAGVLMGLAFLIKQHGAAFILFGGLYLVYRRLDLADRARRRVHLREALLSGLSYSVGVFGCYWLVCLFYLSQGEFGRFWYRTVVYPKSYASSLTFEQGSVLLKERMVDIFGAAPVIWCLVLVGLTALIWCRRIRMQLGLLLGLAVFSSLAVLPGYYFRPHYFVLLLPAAALLAAGGVESLRGLIREHLSARWARVVVSGLALCALITPIYGQRRYLLEATALEACRITFTMNPFWAAREIGQFIRDRTTEDERILVLGSEPEILFYSGRRSVTKHVYMYDLMYGTDTADRIQGELITSAEQQRPTYVVFVDIDASWRTRPESSTRVFEWWDEYQSNYELEAFWKILPRGPRRASAQELELLEGIEPHCVWVYRRRA